MRSGKAIDLFSGCGGLSWGLKNAGFEMVGAVEIDRLAAMTYKLNFPQAEIWGEDIRELSPKKIRKELGLKKGDLTLLAGCPPCQGFSALRTRRHSAQKKDIDNDLIFEVLKFVEEFEPRAIMIENVPGLAKDDRIFAFKLKLEIMGYLTDFEVHNARDYGTPQSRRRMIFMAIKGQKPVFAAKSKKQKTVRDAIGALDEPGLGNDRLHDYEVSRQPHVQRLIEHIPPDGGSRSALPNHMQLACHKRARGFNDIYGRMAWDKPAPTITCGCINPSKGRFLHPEQNRAITAREAALLQGFPKAFKFDISKGHYAVAQMVGNAFPPKFAERHAREIAKLV